MFIKGTNEGWRNLRCADGIHAEWWGWRIAVSKKKILFSRQK